MGCGGGCQHPNWGKWGAVAVNGLLRDPRGTISLTRGGSIGKRQTGQIEEGVHGEKRN